VRGHRVRTEPARAGSVGFLGGALRCLADSEAPPKKIKERAPSADVLGCASACAAGLNLEKKIKK
jgi:hypothetical protein